jgi:hypothetical protein
MNAALHTSPVEAFTIAVRAVDNARETSLGPGRPPHPATATVAAANSASSCAKFTAASYGARFTPSRPLAVARSFSRWARVAALSAAICTRPRKTVSANMRALATRAASYADVHVLALYSRNHDSARR